jgi:hypothetical protein
VVESERARRWMVEVCAFPGLSHPNDEDLSLFPTNEDLFVGALVAGDPGRSETLRLRSGQALGAPAHPGGAGMGRRFICRVPFA